MRPDDLVLFLDENLHNCKAILDALSEANVRVERHGKHFNPGAADVEWLPFIGHQKWLLITVDQNIRYNELERRAIERSQVRAFISPQETLAERRWLHCLFRQFLRYAGSANASPPLLSRRSLRMAVFTSPSLNNVRVKQRVIFAFCWEPMNDAFHLNLRDLPACSLRAGRSARRFLILARSAIRTSRRPGQPRP